MRLPGGRWALLAALLVIVSRVLDGLDGAVALQTAGPATVLYLWAYSSSVIAHAVSFGRPGSALVGGLVMGAVAIPFAVVALRSVVTAAAADDRRAPTG